MKRSDSHNPSPLLAVILFCWVLAASIVPNLWLSAVEPLPFIAAVTNVMLPLGVYLLLMSLSARIGRTSLWMVFVMFFAAFQMVLLYMYGRSVIAVDMFLNLVTTNPGEVGELLGNLLPIVGAVVILYLTPVVASVIAVVRRWRLPLTFMRRSRLVGWVLAGVGMVGLLVGLLTGSSTPLTDLYPLNVFYNVTLAVDRTARLASYPATSASYTFSACSTRPDTLPEIYVAVIGETSRADNWQILGYGRSTNPGLAATPGLVAFPRALSQSNTTHKSVPMLMSALDASNFADSIYNVKSFITAFKEAGFHTAFFTNQNRNRSFIDYFGSEADTCVFIRDNLAPADGRYPDSNLLPYLDSQLAAGHRKLLVVLHTYGSHFSYKDRYEPSDALFRPDAPPEATREYRPALINAYDNTIVATSRLLADIIARLRATGRHAAMIYTSDHGEDIFDDDRALFLHASPCPSFYQIHVPFLLWMSSGYIDAHPDLAASARCNSSRFVASSQAYFHTLMHLAGLSTPRFTPGASLLAPDYTPAHPAYLNDHNRQVTLLDAGLLTPDLRLLDSLRIPY